MQGVHTAYSRNVQAVLTLEDSAAHAGTTRNAQQLRLIFSRIGKYLTHLENSYEEQRYKTSFLKKTVTV